MLVEFRVRNYRCFKDWQTFSLVASADDAWPEHVIEPPPGSQHKLRLLRSAVVYGANASGKTKLLEALQAVRWLVQESDRWKPEEEIPLAPFLLDAASAGQPSEFEITFIQDGVRYQYGFAADRQRVQREVLFGAPHGRTVMYFERSRDASTGEERYTFGPSLKGQNQRLRELTRANALFLSVAATFKHPTLSTVYRWFADKLVGLQAPRTLFLPRALHEERHGELQALLQLADLGIVDYRWRERAAQPAEGAPPEPAPEGATPERKTFVIEMLHQAQGAEPVALPLKDESQGTQQLFFLGEIMLGVLAEGRVCFVDELNASMHPLLAREIIRMFHDPAVNRRNAQLVFNTHDTSLLDPDLLRRDQIWFTEKDSQGAAHLYPLLEFSPRKGEALSRGYLQGRYGAIPFLGDFTTLADQDRCT